MILPVHDYFLVTLATISRVSFGMIRPTVPKWLWLTAAHRNNGDHNPRRFAVKPHSRSRQTVFMHIPKTSGWALIHGVIRIVSPRSAVYAAMDGTLFGGFREFDSFGGEIRSHIYLDPSSLPRRPDFVSGHLTLPTLRRRYKGAQYMTVLREPASRILSH